MTAHLNTAQRVMTGGTISLCIDLGKLLNIRAYSYMDDRMVEATYEGGRIHWSRNEFLELLRRGPEAIEKDADYYLDCNCSGAVADLEGESA